MRVRVRVLVRHPHPCCQQIALSPWQNRTKLAMVPDIVQQVHVGGAELLRRGPGPHPERLVAKPEAFCESEAVDGAHLDGDVKAALEQAALEHHAARRAPVRVGSGAAGVCAEDRDLSGAAARVPAAAVILVARAALRVDEREVHHQDGRAIVADREQRLGEVCPAKHALAAVVRSEGRARAIEQDRLRVPPSTIRYECVCRTRGT